jgi:hypothetical protein
VLRVKSRVQVVRALVQSVALAPRAQSVAQAGEALKVIAQSAVRAQVVTARQPSRLMISLQNRISPRPPRWLPLHRHPRRL